MWPVFDNPRTTGLLSRGSQVRDLPGAPHRFAMWLRPPVSSSRRDSLPLAASVCETCRARHIFNRGVPPLGLPSTLTRGGPMIPAPFAWLTRCRSFATAR